jgi:hypothetical protein
MAKIKKVPKEKNKGQKENFPDCHHHNHHDCYYYYNHYSNFKRQPKKDSEKEEIGGLA